MPKVDTAIRSRAREASAAVEQRGGPLSPSGHPYIISAVQAYAVPLSGIQRPYVVVQVLTRSGLVGYGECKRLSSADLAGTREALLGRSATAYEALQSQAPKDARAALDMALLDILGKATNAPVYRVLGGPTRNKARAIVRLAGASDDELQHDLRTQLARGFAAFLVPVAQPSARNQGSAYMQAGVERFRAMRRVAPDADFAFDCSNQLTPADTASLAAAVEAMHPLWFDAPCPVSNLSTLHKISDETVVPLGFGRDIVNPGTFQDLLREGLMDLLRADMLTYGISGTRKLAALAETYYIAVSPWHDAGPIATAAALHVAASIPNFFIVELPSAGSGTVTALDGFVALPKGPGLGVDVDERELLRYQIA